MSDNITKANVKHPIVTIILLSYNQESFIAQAAKSVLSQDYENLEIILSDDCSSDKTFDILSSIANSYSGKHKVILNQNPYNYGLVKHFNSLIERAHGEIIVIAAGDDISFPDRVRKSVEILKKYDEAMIVGFKDILINEEGSIICNLKDQDKSFKNEIVNLHKLITNRAVHVSAASRAFRKKIYEYFGPLSEYCLTEDTTMLLRGVLLGDAIVSFENAIFYRKHKSSISAPKSLFKMNFENIIEQYLYDSYLAYNKHLINNSTLFKIKSWANKDIKRRNFLLKIQIENSNITIFKLLLKNLLIKSDFTLKEKIKITYRILIIIFNKTLAGMKII